MPLTPFLIEKMDMEASANGILIACFAAGLLVSSLSVGHISDRMASRRTPMIGGLVAIALSTVLFMETTDHYWVLIISRIAAGVAGGTVITMAFALLSDTFSANELGEQMGKSMAGQTMGMMLGPPLGGLLDEKLGRKAPFVFCLILIGIDLAARLLIIEPRTAKIKQIRAFKKQQKQEHQQQLQLQPQ
ncbi:hypothetical protein BGZ97_008636 [Linnemannia gamsii]|uniref:Major facilitator superfamily (MFS) profile domain-containing protein n=1 Tax=Linnemannia gamsii TaxID=64522 RepID=A0A9P6QPD5_9FUNG|nr:hypothetical protein BGZ97_008636 [Linnemannia gamsii]